VAALGLSAALRVGVIHRDVKPANLLIDRNGILKIADLGLAACSDTRLIIESGAADSRAGGLGGTVAYMAPERFSNSGPLDARSDIYSLGISFYEALTGALPFNGSTSLEMMLEHANTPLPSLEGRVPGLSAAGIALIERMCVKNPSERFQDYAELIAALSATFELVPDHAAAVTWNSRWQPITRQFDSVSGSGRLPPPE
jgi:serine/threonine protein kinase